MQEISIISVNVVASNFFFRSFGLTREGKFYKSSEEKEPKLDFFSLEVKKNIKRQFDREEKEVPSRDKWAKNARMDMFFCRL